MHTFESNSNVPAFLIKLWKLVEDSSCNDLIAWSDNGLSFMIKDQSKFAKDLLPQYFKHNNMASFIRQLNMYGFRKVVNYEKSTLRNESDEMEFHHSFFIRDQVELLEMIKRKIPNNRAIETFVNTNPKDILTDLTSIREKQSNMDNMLLKMKHENELLWRELTSMRQKHKAQEQIIQKVIQFLVSVLQRSNNPNIGVQRKITRMLQDGSTSQSTSQPIVLRKKNKDCIVVPEASSPLGPVIHDVTDLDPDDSQSVMIKSPYQVLSPQSIKTPESSKTDDQIACSSIDTSSRISGPISKKSLSILGPGSSASTSTSEVESDPKEYILGLPYEYITGPSSKAITIPDTRGINNVIALPEGSDFSNVINIPEDVELCNIISIPEIHEAIKTITIPNSEENAKSINIPLVKRESNVHGIPECLSIPGFECLDIPSSSSTQDVLTVPLEQIDADYFNSPLQTPKIDISDENVLNMTSKLISSKNKLSSSISNNKGSATEEHNYPLALHDHSTLVKSSDLAKNHLTNHVRNVDENISILRDYIGSDCFKDSTWGLDDSKLLGLFNSGLIFDDTFASDITNDANVKLDENEIIGNEVVQFNPNMLETELDITNSPFFESISGMKDPTDAFGLYSANSSLPTIEVGEVSNSNAIEIAKPHKRRKNLSPSKCKRKRK